MITFGGRGGAGPEGGKKERTSYYISVHSHAYPEVKELTVGRETTSVKGRPEVLSSYSILTSLELEERR